MLSLIAVTVVFGWEFPALLPALCLIIVLGPVLVIHLDHRHRMRQRRGE